MKKSLIKFITVLLILLTLATCKKESNNNIEKINHRIISETNYVGDTPFDEQLYEYTGNKITKTNYSVNTGSNEFHYEYPNENRIIVSYTSKGNNSPTINGTYEMKLSNNRVIELFSDNHKITFTYNYLGKIEEINYYLFNEIKYNYTYTYNSGKLIQRIYTIYQDSLFLQDKMEFTYNGDEINEIINYAKEGEAWSTCSKDVYTYTLGRITKIQQYSYQNNSWVIADYWKYQFDSDDNLIEIDNVISESDGVIQKRKFTYEEGGGNYRQIFGLIEYLPSPIPNKKSQVFRNNMRIDPLNIGLSN